MAEQQPVATENTESQTVSEVPHAPQISEATQKETGVQIAPDSPASLDHSGHKIESHPAEPGGNSIDLTGVAPSNDASSSNSWLGKLANRLQRKKAV